MDNNELDIKAYKNLQTIHWVFCAVMASFIVIIFAFNKLVGYNVITKNDNSLLYVAFLATSIFPIISNYVFYKRLEAIDLDEPVKFRFQNFLNANVIRYLWISGAGVLNLMVWFFTATLLLAIFNGFLLLVLIIIRPIKFKVIRTLRLKPIK